MTETNVNTAKLKEAIEKFGSLQKTIEVLELRKKEIETEVLTVSRDLDVKKKTRAKYLNELDQLDGSIKEHTEKLNEIGTNINKYSQQYRLFESLVTMMQTPPHTVEDLEELAGTILVFSKMVWRSNILPEKARYLFVETVLGNYLHCYRCDRCGLKIIANQEAQSHILGYRCPNCTYMSTMTTDDSFLKAMLGVGESTDDNETSQQED